MDTKSANTGAILCLLFRCQFLADDPEFSHPFSAFQVSYSVIVVYYVEIEFKNHATQR
jgi:hypothetical protein